MWDYLLDRMPSALALTCTALAFFIPLVAFKVSDKLHSQGDPPWKKKRDAD